MNNSRVSTAAVLAGMLLAVFSTRAAEMAPQRTALESAYAEFWTVKEETFFVFKSSAAQRVTLTGTNLKIVCDNLELTAVGITDEDDKNSTGTTLPALEKFKYLLATGNVQIVQGSREATAGRAEVFPREEKVVLSEEPRLVDHVGDRVVDGVVSHADDREVRGSRITMLRGQEKVIVEDSVFEGPALRDLGYERDQPAPGASAPESTATETTSTPATQPSITVPGITPPQK